jgi:two-component sensor histidine kinase
VVQSVVSLTRADTLAEFKTAVEGRIQSLGRAHSMLAASRWEGADLQRVLVEELAPYARRGGGISLSGPPLLLKPAAAQSLALVIHELATNAVKYGALSVASGGAGRRWEVRERTTSAPAPLPASGRNAADRRSHRVAAAERLRQPPDPQQHRTPAWRHAAARLGGGGLVATMEVAFDRSFSSKAAMSSTKLLRQSRTTTQGAPDEREPPASSLLPVQ